MKRRFIFILIAGLLYCSLPSQSLAAKYEMPSRVEQELLNIFKEFDEYYVTWHDGYGSPYGWAELAKRLLKFQQEHRNNPELGKNYFLRATVVRAECHLFATQAIVEGSKARVTNRNRFFNDNYYRGVFAFELVLRTLLEDKANASELAFLPRFSEMRKGMRLHPYAGCESIGTGFAKGFNNRKVTYYKQRGNLNRYASLKSFNAYLSGTPPLSIFRQISPMVTAREFLSAFCPWGVEFYSRLSKVGFSADLDMRVLRAYAGDLGMNALEKSMENTKALVDHIMTNTASIFSSWPNLISYGWVPKISDFLIEPGRVPASVKSDMDRIIGVDSASADKKHIDVTGNLRRDGSIPVQWRVVGTPVCHLWYVSPTIWDWQESDYLKLLIVAAKFFLAEGPMAAALSIIVDEVSPIATVPAVNKAIGPESDTITYVPFISNIISEYLTDKYLRDVKKYQSLADVIENRKGWISHVDLCFDAISYAWDHFQEKMNNYRFEGIDPKKFSPGKSYDGTDIPPVLLRANLIGAGRLLDDSPQRGFKGSQWDGKQAMDEYPSYIDLVRYYAAYPKVTSQKRPGKLVEFGKYDLSGNFTDYKFISLNWEKVQEPLSSHEIITNFAPKRHVLQFTLGDKTYQRINKITKLSNRFKVEAELWTSSSFIREKYVNFAIASDGKVRDQKFNFMLNNKDYPGLSTRFGPAVANCARPLMPVTLKTQYELRLKVNGKYAHKKQAEPYQITLHHGIVQNKNKNTKITGKLRTDAQGNLFLEYDQEIELPFARVKGKLTRGNAVINPAK